ncbi:MAG: hypothetical protein WBX50_06160 [Candidatus Deferrimicrobiaceae bacterium]
MVPIAGKEVKTRRCAIPFPFEAEKPQAVFKVPREVGKPKAASVDNPVALDESEQGAEAVRLVRSGRPKESFIPLRPEKSLAG